MSDLGPELQATGGRIPETRNAPFYPALDGLRAIAVLMVLVLHSSAAYLPWGWMGVQIFFVLSGFLITGILFDSRSATNRFRVFYARRALRIFPLYYGVLIATLLASLGGTRPDHFWMWFVYLQNFAYFLPGTHGFNELVTTHGGITFGAVGHFWSLAVEEQFYLLWPFLVYRLGSRQRIQRACYVLIAVRIVLAIAVWRFFPALSANGFAYRMLPTQWDGFLMGALLALRLRETETGHARLPRVSRVDLVALIAAMSYGALIAVLRHFGKPAIEFTRGFQSMLGLSLANLVSLAILVAVLTTNSALYRLCTLGPMQLVGRISYGFYVYHLFVIILVREHVVHFCRRYSLHGVRILQIIVPGILTLVLSYLSFRFFEAPILRLKRRFVAES